jgi:uncharacterized membrane protein
VSSAWRRSPRLFAYFLVVIAIVIGAHLRFHRLARFDMSGDEGASWAAASAPSVQQVVAAEQRLDPGKLALYDLLLHGWIGIFGDSVFAMRAMSATLGTIAIVLVFVAVREVCCSLQEDRSTASTGELAGAFAALLYAFNLQMVVSDRTMRMYPLVMAAELLQITFFCRAQRSGSLANYVGVAIFTAVMIAANFTSTFLIIAEALWLQCLLLAKDAGLRAGGLMALGPGIAVITGIALLTPMLPGALASSASAVQVGYINWIKVEPVSWPYTTLRDGVGGYALFWTFIILGAFGLWHQWRSGPLASAFFALWTIGPILAAVTLSYAIHSVENPRYVIIAFVGMFAFAAVGAASVRSTVLRIALAVLFIHFTMYPVNRRLRHSHEAAWREAAMVAIESSAPGTAISVVPSYAVNVVRYYLPRDRREAAVGVDFGCGSGRVLILSGREWLPTDLTTRMVNCYPRIVKTFHRVEVRSR